MWLTNLLKKVLGATAPEEQLAMTPLEYLQHLNEKLKGDLERTYHRESMDLTITVIREDIYTLVALMTDCSTNIRQRAALPKEAFLNPSSTERKTMKLKTFLVDYQGRSMGRQACFELLAETVDRLLASLERHNQPDNYDYRSYLLKLEYLIDEISVVIDTYLNDASVRELG